MTTTACLVVGKNQASVVKNTDIEHAGDSKRSFDSFSRSGLTYRVPDGGCATVKLPAPLSFPQCLKCSNTAKSMISKLCLACFQNIYSTSGARPAGEHTSKIDSDKKTRFANITAGKRRRLRQSARG